jgi:hypothetical protein
VRVREKERSIIAASFLFLYYKSVIAAGAHESARPRAAGHCRSLQNTAEMQTRNLTKYYKSRI